MSPRLFTLCLFNKFRFTNGTLNLNFALTPWYAQYIAAFRALIVAVVLILPEILLLV